MIQPGRRSLTLGAGVLLLGIAAQSAWAGNQTRDAAIGGAVGGAAGAAIGSEVGGREGAIVGAAAGAAIGAAIATKDNDNLGNAKSAQPEVIVVHDHGHPSGHFCPPGQAKKGRC
jgi:outer membrane lipoprotein SlyB